MQKVQQIVPISDMRNAQDEVLQKMDQEPVILAARSKPRAVLVNVDEWNRIATELEEREMQLAILEAKLAIASEGEELDWIDEEALAAFAAEQRYKANIRKIGQLVRAQTDPDDMISGEEFIKRTIDRYGLDAFPDDLKAAVTNVAI